MTFLARDTAIPCAARLPGTLSHNSNCLPRPTPPNFPQINPYTRRQPPVIMVAEDMSSSQRAIRISSFARNALMSKIEIKSCKCPLQ